MGVQNSHHPLYEMCLFQDKGKDIFERFGLVHSHAFAVTGVKLVCTLQSTCTYYDLF